MDQHRRLRVVMIGKHDSFGQILTANIRRWGYEAVVLPSTMTMLMNKLSGVVGEEIEADVLLCDLDEAFRISTLMGGKDMPTLFEGSCEEWLPRVRFMIALSSRSVSRMTLEQMGAIALLYKPFEMGRLQRYLRVLQKLFSGDEVLRGGVGELNSPYLKGNVVAYVDKPFHIDQLLRAVEQALRGPRQRRTLQDRMYMCP